MIRTPALVLAALAASLLLTSCVGAAPSGRSSSTPARPATAAHRAGAAWSPCSGSDLDHVTKSIGGKVQLVPNSGDVPPYLPAPSCISYTDHGYSIAEYLGATADDFGTIEQLVIAQQGVPAPGGGVSTTVTSDDYWDHGGVADLRFVTASDGVSVDRIEAVSVIANYTPGG